MRSIRYLLIFLLLWGCVTPVMARPTPAPPSTDKHRFYPEQRKVFWKGSLTVKVDNFVKAREEALRLAQKYDGSTYSEQIRTNRDGRRFGQIDIRVPEAQRYAFLRELHTIGVLYSEKIAAPDVSEEYVDLGRRQRNLTAEEDQLLLILKQAHHVLEVLQVQGHLYNVRVEIETITSRLNEIDMKSTSSLFALNMFEPPVVAAPVAPGGATEFFPRWWALSAEPLIKRQVKDTYYSASTAALEYVLGTKHSIPNVVFLGFYLLVFAVLYKRVWPAYRTQLREALAAARLSDIPWHTMLWSLACLYVCHYFLDPSLLIVVFSLFVLLLWRNFVATPTGETVLATLASRSITPASVQMVAALPLAITLINAVFPEVWSSYVPLLFQSLLLTAAILFLPRYAVRYIEQVKAFRGRQPATP